MSAKIIIASYSESLRTTLKRNISGSNIDVILSYNLIEAASHFSPAEPNILIYDIDRGTKPTNYVRTLLNKYNLLIILTGSSPKKAYDYYAFGVKDYIITPENFNSADGKEFLIAITERVKTFFNSNHGQHKGFSSNQRIFNNTISHTHTHTYTHQNLNHGHPIYNTKFGHKKDFVIAIAASTGGTEALDLIMRALPANLPPILVVQHMPSSMFTQQFAKRLDNFSELTIKEAENFEPIYSGNVYIAPGDLHMTLKKQAGQLILECGTGNRVNGVRPAADILFNSVADTMANKAIGVILTGMGADGAKGLSVMKAAGSINIGQDKESCVVYGMPKVAYDLGALDIQLPLSKIPQKIVELVKKYDI